MVHTVFHGFATALQAPLATDTERAAQVITTEELNQTLEDIGWNFEGSSGRRQKNGIPLQISFIFPDTEETKQIAEVLVNHWRQFGVEAEARALPQKEFTAALNGKRFDAVLLGYEAKDARDLVRLWKSSDRLNLAAVTSFGTPILNGLLDDLKETEPPERLEGVDDWRAVVYDEIKAEMVRSVPAIFLYSPHFLYILPKGIIHTTDEKNQARFSRASERFANVHMWYTHKETIWNILIQ